MPCKQLKSITLLVLVLKFLTPGASLADERTESFRLIPFYAVDDRELYLFASNFLGLIRSVTEPPPNDTFVPEPNFMLFSEEDAIVGGRIRSPKAKQLFEGDEWAYLSQKHSQSEWCYILPIHSTKNPQTLEVVTFIDESDSTLETRKYCFLASVVQIYRMDIDLSAYIGSPNTLALAILSAFLKDQ